MCVCVCVCVCILYNIPMIVFGLVWCLGSFVPHQGLGDVYKKPEVAQKQFHPRIAWRSPASRSATVSRKLIRMQ